MHSIQLPAQCPYKTFTYKKMFTHRVILCHGICPCELIKQHLLCYALLSCLENAQSSMHIGIAPTPMVTVHYSAGL